MVQCKTTNMIEILKLDTEADVCVSYSQQGGLMGKVTASVSCSRSYLVTDHPRHPP